tara:strand:- start:10 stop:339 length:330 start_codon:yes stop_codon:yes gene_type:complete
MNIVKNLQENATGNIDCKLLCRDVWCDFTMSPFDKYEISEDSDWPGIKPCDQATKTAHEAEQVRAGINQEAMAYLAATDWYVVRDMDSGEVIPNDIRLARAEARGKIAV